MKPEFNTAAHVSRIPDEITGLSGPLPAGRIVIVASRYNAEVCDSLAVAAKETLLFAGVAPENVVVMRVPGAWELPLAVARALDDRHVIGAVALGVVIRGDTTHDEHINRAVSMTLMEISLESRKPVGFGLLTCNTPEQATARAGGEVGNKGIEAADAVLEMLRLSKVL